MPNLYGVANCPGVPVAAGTIGGTNVTCPAGSETPVVQSTALIAPSQGYFYGAASGLLSILFGATPPGSCQIAIKFLGGSDITFVGIAGQNLVANACVICPVAFFTGALSANWQGAGSILQVTVNAASQNVTVITGSSYAYFGLYRAPDQ